MKLTEAQAAKAIQGLVLYYKPDWGTKEESQQKALIYVRDLMRWNVDAHALSEAILRVRAELKWMPMLSEIKERLPKEADVSKVNLELEAYNIFRHIRDQEALMLVNRCKGKCYLSLNDLEKAHGKAARNAAAVAGGIERISEIPERYLHLVKPKFVDAYVEFVQEYHGQHRAIQGQQNKQIEGSKSADENKLDNMINAPGEHLLRFRELLKSGRPDAKPVNVEERLAELRKQAEEIAS